MGLLEGKVALVTGGTAGIGEASARRFVKEGARVVIAARRVEKGRALVEELGPAHAAFVRADVTDPAQIQAAVAAAVARFGRLDCMFNNAGEVKGDGPLDTLTPDNVGALNAVLYNSVIFGTQAAARVMRGQGGGAILNNASIASHLAGYAFHVYSGLKAAVRQFTRSVAMELAPAGIRVNSVSPGPIVTQIFGRAIGQDAAEAEVAQERLNEVFRAITPVKRPGTGDDIAAAAAWLLSDSASFVVGQDLVVDGGVIAGRPFEDTIEAFRALHQALTSST